MKHGRVACNGTDITKKTIILSHINISSFQLVYSLEVENMTKSIVILSLGTMKFENFACFVVGFPILQCFIQGFFQHSYVILGARMLWKPKEARILKNFIDQPV